MARLANYQKKDLEIFNEDLSDCYNNYLIMLKICLMAKDRAVSDKSNKYIFSLGGKLLGNKTKTNRDKEIEIFFDNLQQDLIDSYFINIVATFEKIIFSKIPTAVGDTRKIVKDNYNEKGPFGLVIGRFIKATNDFKNLSNIKELLRGKIPSDLFDVFDEIVNYRNRIAHGKRFGEETTLNLEDLICNLDNIIQSVA
ncbi:MAG: hypothetical protein K8R79_05675 [Calditrichales bacterium]|nr:hypothetical protein [Calditrichales bacterium]